AAVHHTCVEAVERAHRRPAYNAALGVIDAAVAGADEALGRLHVAHRAAEVRAAGGDGHVWKRRLALVARAAVGRGGLADVDRGLPRLADVRDDRDHPRHIGLRVEVGLRPHVLPALVHRLLEDRTESEAQSGQADRRRGHAPGRERAAGDQPATGDRLALERTENTAVLGVGRLLFLARIGHVEGAGI